MKIQCFSDKFFAIFFRSKTQILFALLISIGSMACKNSAIPQAKQNFEKSSKNTQSKADQNEEQGPATEKKITPETEPDEIDVPFPDTLPEVGKSNDKETPEGKKAPAKTPVEKYIFPLQAGDVGSAWCKCRDIGTSPHIGQDYRLLGTGLSLAISNGTVEYVGLRNSACGYEVQFIDSAGAKWVYLHLDKPKVKSGDVVFQGEIFGTHKNYPVVGECGSGPHLHLERHSAGELGGKSTRNDSCARRVGSGTCNYDPVTVLKDKMQAGNETKRLQILASAKGTDPGSFALSGEISSEAIKETAALDCNPNQQAPVAVEAGEPTGAEKLTEEKAQIVAKRFRRPGTKPALFKLTITPVTQNTRNPGNFCKPELNCFSSWELQSQQKDGAWLNVAQDHASRNVPISIRFDSNHCLPAEATDTYRILLTSNQGTLFTVEGQFQSAP